MINLSINRDLIKLSQFFYKKNENELIKRIWANIAFLNQPEYFLKTANANLGDYLFDNIKEIISENLEIIISNHGIHLKDILKNNYKKIAKKDTEFKIRFDNIFFFQEHDKWGAYNFVKMLEINCCPYCNRTYITNLGDDKNKFSRPDIDHFLPKYKYPYLRFSFFNLIPSCVICNRNAKGRNETSLEKNIYPYQEGFDDNTKITYNPKYYYDMKGTGKPYIKFEYFGDSKHKKKSKKNVEIFKLNEQYSIHVNELNHLLRIKDIHGQGYIKDLMSKYPTLLKNEEEAYFLAFGKEFNISQDESLPLSKFTRDILTDLRMLNLLKNK